MTRWMRALIGVSALVASTAPESQGQTMNDEFLIAIHGGGGVRSRAEMTDELERGYRAALRAALEAGHDVLSSGGNGISAVEAAIRVMEDSPLFNAGKGASYNAEGFHELDASIMEGAALDAGAVAVVKGVKNPITLARHVMEHSPHVMMAGDGAREFAKRQGLDIVAPHYFHTDRKWESLERRLEQQTKFGKPTSADSDDQFDPGLFGTVGAVALDRHGNLAAGTSTGGREGKLPGRVGDSPIIGGGTYAKNATLAVSSTGLGEYVIRIGGTKTMSDLMEYRGLSLDEATNAVKKMIADMGGGIGVVAIDRDGNVSMPFSGDGMYRGYVRHDGNYVVRIYDD